MNNKKYKYLDLHNFIVTPELPKIQPDNNDGCYLVGFCGQFKTTRR